MSGAVIAGTAMLPAAWPAFRLHRFLGGRGEVLLLAVAYLAVWIAVAAVAMLAKPPVGPALAAAGLYQLGPLQASSLRRCRSRLGPLVRRSSLRAGVEVLRVRDDPYEHEFVANCAFASRFAYSSAD
jgi:predicted metal-binding membrane protein